MTTARNLTIAAAAAGLVLVAGASATASTTTTSSADADNTMTFEEWYDVLGGETQANVQAPSEGARLVGCGCTGVKIRQWVGHDGHARKWVQYEAGAPSAAILEYRLTVDGVWHTSRVKFYAADSTAEPFYYGRPTF